MHNLSKHHNVVKMKNQAIQTHLLLGFVPPTCFELILMNGQSSTVDQKTRFRSTPAAALHVEIRRHALCRARRRILSCSSLSLTPVQNKTHDAAQVWDHNCGGISLQEFTAMSGAMKRERSKAVAVVLPRYLRNVDRSAFRQHDHKL